MRGLAALPEHQRVCLRKVLEHKSSKEIAIELGISPHTVDQRLKAAMQTLGVGSRVAAAQASGCVHHHDSVPGSGAASGSGARLALKLPRSEPFSSEATAARLIMELRPGTMPSVSTS